MNELFLIGPGDRGLLDPKLVGSKAANLSRVAALEIGVPPAFVLSSQLCEPINDGELGAEAKLTRGLAEGVKHLEQITGRRFGDPRRPLFVSVRSGAACSMPGMLDTVLNVGLTPETLKGLIRSTGNPRFAWDCYRRFAQGYGEVVLGVSGTAFDRRLNQLLREEQAVSETELDGEALERLTADFLDVVAASAGVIPDDVVQQLAEAARAVYRSWRSRRACEYRRFNGLDHLTGTAVTVQAMVFGNASGRSGSGVVFSRNPATGANELYADFLPGAQGEDVVSGRREPGTLEILRTRLPRVAEQLSAIARSLERTFGDVQDIEFTVEDGVLYILQTRAAKRTPRAALTIAVDLVNEGLITPKEALARIDGIDPERLCDEHFAGSAAPVAIAVPASPGVATGRVAFDSKRAVALSAAQPVVLVRPDTSTDDLPGFAAANGILTALGGRTAHAAVVARQLGKACLVGCAALIWTPDGRTLLAGTVIAEGDWLSIDGSSGEVFFGQREIVRDQPHAELAKIASWRAALAASGKSGAEEAVGV